MWSSFFTTCSKCSLFLMVPFLSMGLKSLSATHRDEGAWSWAWEWITAVLEFQLHYLLRSVTLARWLRFCDLRFPPQKYDNLSASWVTRKFTDWTPGPFLLLLALASLSHFLSSSPLPVSMGHLWGCPPPTCIELGTGSPTISLFMTEKKIRPCFLL